MELSYLALCESEGFSVELQVEIELHMGSHSSEDRKVRGWEGQPPPKISQETPVKEGFTECQYLCTWYIFHSCILLGGEKKTEGREMKINCKNIPIAQ